MKVIIDDREHSLYDKCESLMLTQPNASYVQLSKEVLPIGDILFQTDEGKDVLLIERKSFSDLLSSLKDGRYEEQSYRLLHSSGFPPHSIFYLLEGMFSQLRSAMEKKIIYSTMTSLQFFKGFSVQRTATTSETAEWILYMADKIERDFLKGKYPYYLSTPYLRTIATPISQTPSTLVSMLCGSDSLQEPISNQPPLSNDIVLTAANYCTVVKKVKKDNVTPENIGEIILCQIPGISSVTAMAIMKNYTSYPQFMEAMYKDPHCIDNINTETNGKLRKISKSCASNIRRYLLKSEGAAEEVADLTGSL